MITKLFDGKPLPISRGQEAMIYGENYGARDAKAILIEGRELYGKLDVQKMTESIYSAAADQEALRMICVKEDGKYYLQLRDKLDCGDVVFLRDHDNKNDVIRDVLESVSGSVELDKSLFRVRVYSLSDELHIIAVIIHHLIADNITLSVVMSDILSRYEGKTRSVPAPFSRFIQEEAQFAASDAGMKQIEHWKKEMEGYIPLKGDGGGVPYDVISSTSFKVPAVKLTEIGKELKVSPFVLLLSAAHIALGQVKGSNDTTIGLAFANRMDRKFRETAGYLAHMVQNRMKDADRSDKIGFVKAVAKKMSQNIRDQRLSHYAPGARVNIGMQGDPLHMKKDLFNGKETVRIPFDFDRNVDYLMISIVPGAESYTIYLICDPAVYSLDLARRITKGIADSISEIIGSEDSLYD